MQRLTNRKEEEEAQEARRARKGDRRGLPKGPRVLTELKTTNEHQPGVHLRRAFGGCDADDVRLPCVRRERQRRRHLRGRHGVPAS